MLRERASPSRLAGQTPNGGARDGPTSGAPFAGSLAADPTGGSGSAPNVRATAQSRGDTAARPTPVWCARGEVAQIDVVRRGLGAVSGPLACRRLRRCTLRGVCLGRLSAPTACGAAADGRDFPRGDTQAAEGTVRQLSGVRRSSVGGAAAVAALSCMIREMWPGGGVCTGLWGVRCAEMCCLEPRDRRVRAGRNPSKRSTGSSVITEVSVLS